MFALIFMIATVFGLDDASNEGLQKTQDLLKNRQKREEAAKETPEAAAAHQKLKDVAGSAENEDQIYGVSAEIFAELTKEANGDPQKLQELMVKFQANPKAFYDKLSPAQREKIRGIAQDIEKNQGRPSKP